MGCSLNLSSRSLTMITTAGVFRELPGCGFQCVYDPDRVEKDANDQISTESIWEEWLLCADKAIDPSNRTEARKPTRENAPCTLIQGTEKESSVKSVSSFSTTGVIILLVVVITMILTILLLYRYRATPILQKIWKKIRNSFGPTSDFQNPKGIDLPKPGDDRASARTWCECDARTIGYFSTSIQASGSRDKLGYSFHELCFWCFMLFRLGLFLILVCTLLLGGFNGRSVSTKHHGFKFLAISLVWCLSSQNNWLAPSLLFISLVVKSGHSHNSHNNYTLLHPFCPSNSLCIMEFQRL